MANNKGSIADECEKWLRQVVKNQGCTCFFSQPACIGAMRQAMVASQMLVALVVMLVGSVEGQAAIDRSPSPFAMRSDTTSAGPLSHIISACSAA